MASLSAKPSESYELPDESSLLPPMVHTSGSFRITIQWEEYKAGNSKRSSSQVTQYQLEIQTHRDEHMIFQSETDEVTPAPSSTLLEHSECISSGFYRCRGKKFAYDHLVHRRDPYENAQLFYQYRYRVRRKELDWTEFSPLSSRIVVEKQQPPERTNVLFLKSTIPKCIELHWENFIQDTVFEYGKT